MSTGEHPGRFSALKLLPHPLIPRKHSENVQQTLKMAVCLPTLPLSPAPTAVVRFVLELVWAPSLAVTDCVVGWSTGHPSPTTQGDVINAVLMEHGLNFQMARKLTFWRKN